MRFYYLLKNGFGSRINNPAFSISTVRPSNFNLLRIEEELSEAHLRLARVYVENLPYARFIERFDRPDTLFYVDPPYLGCENYYGKDIFHREDFAKLAGILARVQGKFVMSINDTEEIRSIFKNFYLEKITTSYSVSAKSNRGKVTELLFTNFK